MHARCMLDRAEHLARRHADPRPCVACRLAWPGGNRPLHPPALARGVSMFGHEKRPAAVRSHTGGNRPDGGERPANKGEGEAARRRWECR